METTVAPWSSLRSDLVNRIADCLLATNDLDYYMNLRAVCYNWRSTTIDPKTSDDIRFQPTQWIMLDEFCKKVDSRLFVNASTGRFLRKELPLLRGDHSYLFLTTTTGGFVILVNRRRQNTVSILNPFTGRFIHFSTSVTLPFFRTELTAAVVGPLPTLVLASAATSESEPDVVYWADPQSKCFHVDRPVYGNGSLCASRLPIIAEKYAADVGPSHYMEANRLWDQELQMGSRCFVVDWSQDQVLLIFKRKGERRIVVLKVDSAGQMIQQVKSIDTRAMFLGTRCLLVDADRFPSIRSNKIYYL